MYRMLRTHIYVYIVIYMTRWGAREIFNKLYFSVATTVGTHRNREMPSYLLFIDIFGGNYHYRNGKI